MIQNKNFRGIKLICGVDQNIIKARNRRKIIIVCKSLSTKEIEIYIDIKPAELVAKIVP